MNPPEISVLIPTYDYARYLPEAIESVLAQDFRDFELLIVDDHSSDDTAEVVRPFCARDARVQFEVNPANLGMVENWKHCLTKARGQYIKFLFGDDKLSHPQALSQMRAELRNNPSATLAASARVMLDEESKVIEILRPLREGCHNGKRIIQRCLVENANLVGEPSAVMFRKKDVQRGFDSKFRQIVDLELWFRLLEEGDLAYIGEPLCAFRSHPGQQSAFNQSSGLTWKEHALFFASYGAKPWVPQKARFHALYGLRRARRKHPGEGSPEMLEWEQRLSQQMGKAQYASHWVWYKLTHPFRSIHRSVRKRQ